MIQNLFATLLFAGSVANTPILMPRKAMYNKVTGTYNLVNSINNAYLTNYTEYKETYIWFDNTTFDSELQAPKYSVPLRYDNKTYYLNNIYLEWYPNNEYMSIEIVMYDAYLVNETIEVLYYDSMNLEDIEDYTFAQIYFNVMDAILLSELQTNLFNSVFTREENLYTVNYTGYYAFNNSLTQFNQTSSNMLGTITIGQNMYNQITTVHNMPTSRDFIMARYYNAQTDGYDTKFLYAPFNNYGTSNQWYLSVKMTQNEYNRWQSYGVFGYVPQVQPGEYEFDDLFFSLVDTPIYFVYSIFNWKLFGANLFIAFTGLVSFALVLILFRRFAM